MSDRTPDYEVELMDGTVLPIYFEPWWVGDLDVVVTHTFYGGNKVQVSSGSNETTAINHTLYVLGGGPTILDGKVYQEWINPEHRLAPIKQVRKVK